MDILKYNKSIPFFWTLASLVLVITLVLVHAKMTGAFHWESIKYYSTALISGGGVLDIKQNFKIKDERIKELEIEIEKLRK